MSTIKDIANKAGVSPTTVSNVIHGRLDKVSKETLDRVRKVIEESNYVSNMGARLLANNGSKIIGVILTYGRRNERNAIQDPFYSEIIGALEQEIRQKGYYMMLYTSADIEESLRLAKAWNIEGMIVLGSNSEGCKRFMESTNIPIVFIDSYFYDDGIVYANVGLQDREGAYQMTKYLIEQGHRNIAFLADASPQELTGVDKERWEGYQQAMREYHLPTRQSDYIHISYRFQERHQMLDDFIKYRLKDYTALFFASDFYAVDAISHFKDHNIDVPKDISVVGFDDNIYAVLSRPQLTTVHQNVSLKAEYAVELVMKLIKNEEITDYNIRIPTRLVIRNSSSVPRAAPCQG